MEATAATTNRSVSSCGVPQLTPVMTSATLILTLKEQLMETVDSCGDKMLHTSHAMQSMYFMDLFIIVTKMYMIHIFDFLPRQFN